MGRAPCCDKANVKKGPWSPEEDSILKSYIEQHGTGGNWIALPQKIGLKRCGKSCRLRWLNYLRPNIKHGGFSQEEDNIICSLYINIGSRWSIIAAQLPGRTDNDIKNYWNTRLKNKLLGKQRKNQQARRSIIPNQAEIKKENESGTFDLLNPEPGFIMNQTRPYWADMSATTMPVLDPNYYDSQALKDQNSLKNLLFKLGGKFSESNSNIIDFEYPIDISNCGQLDHYNGTLFNSATTSTSTTTYVHDQFDAYFQGIENLQAELNELIYVNPQPLDDQPDQGCFNGWDHMVNGSTRTSSASAENSGTTWGEINSSNNFVGPRLVSDSEIYQKDLMSQVQDSSGSAFEEYSSYFGQK